MPVSTGSKSPPSKRSSLAPVESQSQYEEQLVTPSKVIRPSRTTDDACLSLIKSSQQRDCVIGGAGIILTSNQLLKTASKTRLVMISSKKPEEARLPEIALEEGSLVRQKQKRRRSLSASTRKSVQESVQIQQQPEEESVVLHPDSVDLARRLARPKVRVIYACPIKNCPVACSSEAAFQRHFDRDHLKNQPSGVLMFPRRPQTPEENLLDGFPFDDSQLLQSLDLVCNNQPVPALITPEPEPPHFIPDKSEELPLNDEENRSLLQALDLIPDSLLEELRSMDTGTVHENVAKFTDLLDSDKPVIVDDADSYVSITSSGTEPKRLLNPVNPSDTVRID
ncbi:hypothetical protein Ciccas_003848 [Cichlidogyrus casuarinus]|uniref:C2H2-type domain-containing protein n=1 Tax=Cichlidogyrus casuarinus TaxID=1844966 RepID=A0ABD2QD78_9PLAT